MKLDPNNVPTSMDLAFELPAEGVSIAQFEEGITKQTNEKSGKTTLRLPLVIDRVIEGPDDNAGKKMSHFVPIETEFGERQLASIIGMAGLTGQFVKNMGLEINVQDDKFLNALKLKLPGKLVTVHHGIRKDLNGKDQVNIVKMVAVDSKPGKQGKNPTPPLPTGSPKPVETKAEDWE